jgi:hypothetical protein
MRFSSAIAFAGHQIHFCRYRKAGPSCAGSATICAASGCSTSRVATGTGLWFPLGSPGPGRVSSGA